MNHELLSDVQQQWRTFISHGCHATDLYIYALHHFGTTKFKKEEKKQKRGKSGKKITKEKKHFTAHQALHYTSSTALPLASHFLLLFPLSLVTSELPLSLSLSSLWHYKIQKRRKKQKRGKSGKKITKEKEKSTSLHIKHFTTHRALHSPCFPFSPPLPTFSCHLRTLSLSLSSLWHYKIQKRRKNLSLSLSLSLRLIALFKVLLRIFLLLCNTALYITYTHLHYTTSSPPIQYELHRLT